MLKFFFENKMNRWDVLVLAIAICVNLSISNLLLGFLAGLGILIVGGTISALGSQKYARN